MGRNISWWREGIQNVIDGNVDYEWFAYKHWRKDGLLNFGLRLCKDVAPSRIKQVEFNGKTYKVPHFHSSLFEPLSGDDIPKFILYKLLSFGSEKRFAIRNRNLSSQRLGHETLPFQWRNDEYLSFKNFQPHFSERPKSQDRYLVPGQDETFWCCSDIDCHSPDAYSEPSIEARHQFAFEVETLHRALAQHPDIFGGLPYRVAPEFRNAYPGAHNFILFDRPASTQVAIAQLRQFTKEIGLDPKTEIYPNGRLLLAPCAPSHTIITDKPHTALRDKVNALSTIWWDWDEPYELAAWNDIEDYLIQYCSLPVLPESYAPPLQPGLSNVVQHPAVVRPTKHPVPPHTASGVAGRVTGPSNHAIYGKANFAPCVDKLYKKPHTDVVVGERDLWLTSTAGRVLFDLQRAHHANCPFDLFEEAVYQANQSLGQPLPEKEIKPKINRLFYKYRNDGAIPFKQNTNPDTQRERSSPSDFALTGGSKFERSDEYNSRRALIEQALATHCLPIIRPGTPLQYVTITDLSEHIALHHDFSDIGKRSLSQHIGDWVRNHFTLPDGTKIRGVRRTIDGKPQTVYYGLVLSDNPHTAYNSKTKRCILKYGGHVYRLFANTLDEAEREFHRRELNNRFPSYRPRVNLVPTMTLQSGMPVDQRELGDPGWRVRAEESMKMTFSRRYGRTLTRLRE